MRNAVTRQKITITGIIADDGNAAKVIVKRSTDPEITWWMKKETIEKILDRAMFKLRGQSQRRL